MNRSEFCCRRGFTLIEMIVALSIGSTVMLAAAALAHTALRMYTHSHQYWQSQQRLDRLVETFRVDASQATEFVLDSSNRLLLIQSESQQIEYSSSEHAIIRILKSETGEHSETTKLPSGLEAMYATSGRTVTLQLAVADNSPADSGLRPLERICVASVGGLASRQATTDSGGAAQ